LIEFVLELSKNVAQIGPAASCRRCAGSRCVGRRRLLPELACKITENIADAASRR
jgi:hypothetical protein